jgi:predicted nucleotide-binding protein
MGDPVGNLVDEAQMYEGFLIALAQEIEQHPSDVLDRPTSDGQTDVGQIQVPAPQGDAIFIVHGHDELNLYRLKEILRERYSLEPIVLASEAGQGRTLIEKFEAEAQRAAFAFVLLTPDDLISKPDGSYSQARPNVIFELGWFYGRLARKRVCILFRKGTKLHSDLDGISRIEFAENVIEKIAEIERELVASGLLRPKKA